MIGADRNALAAASALGRIDNGYSVYYAYRFVIAYSRTVAVSVTAESALALAVVELLNG